MAALIPKFQTFVDLRNGTTIGITVVTALSASDTITVPTLAATTVTNSTAQLEGPGNEGTPTITASGNTVTIASGTVGNDYLIVTRHPNSVINFGAEA